MVLNQSVHEYGPCFQINSFIATYIRRILNFFFKTALDISNEVFA